MFLLWLDLRSVELYVAGHVCAEDKKLLKKSSDSCSCVACISRVKHRNHFSIICASATCVGLLKCMMRILIICSSAFDRRPLTQMYKPIYVSLVLIVSSTNVFRPYKYRNFIRFSLCCFK